MAAEGFEPYDHHVPQQSRRDKLRVLPQSHQNDGVLTFHRGCAGLAPLYDPSPILSTDLLTCTTNLHPTTRNADPFGPDPTRFVKEESSSLFATSSAAQHHTYMVNPPPPIQHNNADPIFYTVRLADPTGIDDLSVYKPIASREPYDMTSQGLSLSLYSHPTVHNSLPPELNLQSRCDYSSVSNEFTIKSSVPLGPFTGYASVLKGSRFLKPAQQLLEEICAVGRGICDERMAADSGLMMDPDSPEGLEANADFVDSRSSSGDGGGQRRKKSRLIALLDEVYRRYKQYYDQLQTVIASFESVAGLSSAAPFANLALKALSKHFRSLKSAIIDQLQFRTDQISYEHDNGSKLKKPGGGLHSQRPFHTAEFMEHQPVWRPQRGLPERAVTVLRAWLFDHFLHPYPTDTDKMMLAKQTGLSRNQVSNWFINARVRIWKPMVEEIHMLETRQAQKSTQIEEPNDNGSNDCAPSSYSLVSENPSTSKQNLQDLPLAQSSCEMTNVPSGHKEPTNSPFDEFSRYPRLGLGTSAAGSTSGVSLTLGLHQNNFVGLAEPFRMDAAHRFGLDMDNEGYVVSGILEAQNRQFGREIIEGNLLRDFVG